MDNSKMEPQLPISNARGVETMNKLRIALVLTGLGLSGTSLVLLTSNSQGNEGNGGIGGGNGQSGASLQITQIKPRTNATELSALGLVGATITATGIYLA